MLKGIGASQGYGIGNAVVISDAKLDYNHVEFTTAQKWDFTITGFFISRTP